MNASEVFTGLSNFLLDGVTKYGGWSTEPGYEKNPSPLNTGEALCGLICARQHLKVVGKLPENFDSTIRKAIDYLFDNQLPSGGWADTYSTPPKGNIISTCLAIWALLLNDDLFFYSPERVVNTINRSLDFFEQCRLDDGLYRQSHDSNESSVILSAYVFLSYTLILSRQNIRDKLANEKLLKTENTFIKDGDNLCDSKIIEDAKKHRISVILIYLSIQYLRNCQNLLGEGTYKKIEELYRSEIMKLTMEECTTVYQKPIKAKGQGQFIHYVPVWMLMIYSQCERTSAKIIQYRHQVLSAIIKNINNEKFYGATSDQRYTIWATAITLFSLSIFLSNCNFVLILNAEKKLLDDRDGRNSTSR
jgi:hypothetical protein